MTPLTYLYDYIIYTGRITEPWKCQKWQIFRLENPLTNLCSKWPLVITSTVNIVSIDGSSMHAYICVCVYGTNERMTPLIPIWLDNIQDELQHLEHVQLPWPILILTPPINIMSMDGSSHQRTIHRTHHRTLFMSKLTIRLANDLTNPYPKWRPVICSKLYIHGTHACTTPLMHLYDNIMCPRRKN